MGVSWWRHMCEARIIRWSAFLAIGAISLSLLASNTSAVAESPRTAPPIGTLLADLRTPHAHVTSADISGSTAVVGVVQGPKRSIGRAYVFTKTTAGWTQVDELKGTLHGGLGFGESVAISGTTIVVGGAGWLYVFTKTAASWTQAAQLAEGPHNANNPFGAQVAISGTNVIVGARSQHGAAYVFSNTPSGWQQAAMLKPSGPNESDDEFGLSVAISGTTALVGQGRGPAHVFAKTATGWKQTAVLEEGRDVEDLFAISGTTAVVLTDLVGARSDCCREVFGGFTKRDAGWEQTGRLKGSISGGISVAISGTTAIIGAPATNTTLGRAYVFTKTGTIWKQVAELHDPNTPVGASFGTLVAMSGRTAVVGESYDGSAGADDEVYLFQA